MERKVGNEWMSDLNSGQTRDLLDGLGEERGLTQLEKSGKIPNILVEILTVEECITLPEQH